MTVMDELKVLNIRPKAIIRLCITGEAVLNGCYDKVYFTAIRNKSKKLKKLITNV